MQTCCGRRWKNSVVHLQATKAFRIQGVLDFSLVGILSKIAALLAESQIAIFAVSTYNTDYVLTKKEGYDKAIDVLRNAGYQIAE